MNLMQFLLIKIFNFNRFANIIIIKLKIFKNPLCIVIKK